MYFCLSTELLVVLAFCWDECELQLLYATAITWTKQADKVMYLNVCMNLYLKYKAAESELSTLRMMP